MASPQTSPQHPALCGAPGCGAGIWFALTANHKPIPLDAEPSPDGTIAVRRDVHGTYHARILSAGPPLARDEKQYKSHFATCADPDAFRRERERARRARPVREPGQPAQLSLSLFDTPEETR